MTESLSIPDDLLERASAALSSYASSAEPGFHRAMAEVCVEGLERIRSDIDLKDVQLPLFARRHLNEFVERLRAIARGIGDPAETLFWLAFMIYALFRERQLRTTSFAAQDLKLFALFDERYKDFRPDQKVRIDYLRGRLQFDVIQEHSRTLLKAVEEKVTAERLRIDPIAGKIDAWDGKLQKWDARASELQAVLSKAVEHLNFVGLAGAFTEQITTRSRERWIYVASLAILGILLVVVPVVPHLLPQNLGLSLAWSTESIPKATALALVELVLLYFFRVFLRNYYSVKAQLSQLELRRSLCAFIQSYAEFVKKIRDEADPRALDRFEALIFSTIVAEPTGVPSHFDGLKDLVTLVQQAKGK